MIDWVGAGAGAIWIIGLAVVFATVSRARWLASERRTSFGAVLGEPGYQWACHGGLALLSAGLAPGTPVPWQRVAWAALALLFTALGLQDRRRGKGLPAADLAIPGAPVGSGETARTDHPDSRHSMRAALAAALHHFELWCVLAALPFLILSTPYSGWAAAAILVLWLLRLTLGGRLSRRTTVDWPMLGLLAMLAVTHWATVDPSLTQPALYRLMAGVALFFAVVNWATSPRRQTPVAALLVLGGVGLAVVAFLANTGWHSSRFFNARSILTALPTLAKPVFAEDINSNVLGAGLMLVIPVGIALLLEPVAGAGLRTAAQRLALALSLLLMGSVFVLAQSRASLVGLAAALTVMASLRWRWARCAALLTAVAAVLWLWQGGAPRLQVLADALSSTGTISSLASRQEVWSRAIYAIQDFPFTGIGLGTFDLLQPLLYPFFLTTVQVHHAHNLYLQVAVDLGLPALVSYLAIVFGALCATWQALGPVLRAAAPEKPGRVPPQVGKEHPVRSALLFGVLGSQVAWLVHGLMDDGIWASKISFMPWLILGLAIALTSGIANLPEDGVPT
jgi:putative inorganic carbon (HCO3(-)) transporter